MQLHMPSSIKDHATRNLHSPDTDIFQHCICTINVYVHTVRRDMGLEFYINRIDMVQSQHQTTKQPSRTNQKTSYSQRKNVIFLNTPSNMTRSRAPKMSKIGKAIQFSSRLRPSAARKPSTRESMDSATPAEKV